MPDYAELYPSRFLKKEVLSAPKLIRITQVRVEQLEDDKGAKEDKVTVKYKAADGASEIVWPKTNAVLTAVALGTRDYKQWEGKLLVIYYEPKVRFAGKNVGGIRILGSPTMEKPAEVMIKMPRSKRKEFYLLVPTDNKGAPKPGMPEPGMELQARLPADASGNDMPPLDLDADIPFGADMPPDAA